MHAVENWDSLPFAEQAEMQDKKIRGIVQEVAKYHPAYRQLMKERHIDPSDIRSVDDFVKKFPFTTKNDIAPTDENPFKPSYYVLQNTGDASYMPYFMIATTGRTAFSTPFWYTEWDMENILMPVARRVGAVTGMTKRDIIINSFPYSPHLAFWLVYYATTGCGLTAIHTGGGKIMGTQKIVDITVSLKGSVFVGVPGYMFHTFKTAQGSEKFLDNIRLLITGGDRCPITFRRNITEILNSMNAQDPKICAAYGFTESRIAPVECPHPKGAAGELTGYHTYPDLELWYVIDPKTGERVGANEPGELVWTALGGRGTLVLNYRTGDLAESGIKYEKCPWCGRTVPIICSLLSRVSEVKNVHFDKVKGTLLDLNQFYSIIPEFEGIDEWQVVLQRGEMMIDELIINVSVKKAKKLNEEQYKRELSDFIQRKMEISPNAINILTQDAMSRALGMETQLKEKRIVDLRPK